MAQTSFTVVFVIPLTVCLVVLSLVQVDTSPLHKRRTVDQEWEEDRNPADKDDQGRNYRMMRDLLPSQSTGNRQTAGTVSEMRSTSNQQVRGSARVLLQAPQSAGMYRGKRAYHCPLKSGCPLNVTATPLIDTITSFLKTL